MDHLLQVAKRSANLAQETGNKIAIENARIAARKASNIAVNIGDVESARLAAAVMAEYVRSKKRKYGRFTVA